MDTFKIVFYGAAIIAVLFVLFGFLGLLMSCDCITKKFTCPLIMISFFYLFLTAVVLVAMVLVFAMSGSIVDYASTFVAGKCTGTDDLTKAKQSTKEQPETCQTITNSFLEFFCKEDDLDPCYMNSTSSGNLLASRITLSHLHQVPSPYFKTHIQFHSIPHGPTRLPRFTERVIPIKPDTSTPTEFLTQKHSPDTNEDVNSSEDDTQTTEDTCDCETIKNSSAGEFVYYFEKTVDYALSDFRMIITLFCAVLAVVLLILFISFCCYRKELLSLQKKAAQAAKTRRIAPIPVSDEDFDFGDSVADNLYPMQTYPSNSRQKQQPKQQMSHPHLSQQQQQQQMQMQFYNMQQQQQMAYRNAAAQGNFISDYGYDF